MPTYEYRCTDCGQHIEVVQTFTDDPLTVCPTCGGMLRKVFSPIGVVLKGSGFYRTDSRSRASRDGKKKAETTAASKDSGTSSSSDSGGGGSSSSSSSSTGGSSGDAKSA